MKHLIIACLLICFQTAFSQEADSIRILEHLVKIIDTDKPRNHANIESLNQVATYIYSELNTYADSTNFQEFEVDGKTYKNIIGSFGTQNDQRIILGAHYDVCGNQDGADDNASSIAAMLELARLLKGQELNYRIDLVAYSLEEPPYFGTKQMGSYVHAKYLNDNQIDVLGMICLDMIGYFDANKKSQKYPLGILKLFYGSRGDYLTTVQKFGPGKFARKFHKTIKRQKGVKIKKFKGPAKLRGISYSDHLNYWRFGYSSIFITDTGFYRNPYYHQQGDSLETLDLNKITAATNMLFKSLLELN